MKQCRGGQFLKCLFIKLDTEGLNPLIIKSLGKQGTGGEVLTTLQKVALKLFYYRSYQAKVFQKKLTPKL